MTIDEMHIAVNLGVQKIASFQMDNFLPQEIDFELNTAMDRFIKQRYSTLSNRYKRGFEQSQKRIDDLRHLVVESQLDAYYKGETIGFEEFFIDRVKLPTDYLFLVSVLARIKYDCSGITATTEPTTKTYYKVSVAPPANCRGCQIESISFAGTTEISKDPYLTLEDLLNATLYQNLIPHISIPDGAGNENNGINTNTTQLYNPVDSNYIYLESQNTGNIVVTWTDPTGTLSNTTVTIQSQNFAYQTSTSKRDAEVSEKNIVCKYIHQDDIYVILEDPFNTTKYTSPVYTVAENYIDIHTDTIFIVDYVRLKYIRIPKRMSLSLGVGCELPLHTHQEIVEMTIKSILEGIESQRYTSQSMETIEVE